MKTPEELKLLVKEKYAEIAEQFDDAGCCCGCGPVTAAGQPVYNIMTDDYSSVKGHVADADLGLGCGIPTEHAGITQGMTVLDLGSGAGNDVFIAASEVGAAGRVIGVDMTESMIARAVTNQTSLGLRNVEFRLGEIEQLPVADGEVDVVISNCVLNLVPDKTRAFAEILRVLKPGGHFAVSDIVIEGRMPEALQEVAELYAGCVSGAIQKSEYLSIIGEAGFSNIEIRKEKEIVMPPALLEELTQELPKEQRDLGGARILSITVRAGKPA